jgi:hypothetical protein
VSPIHVRGLCRSCAQPDVQIIMRNDPYTHFSQQPHNKLTWLVIFYFFFTKRKEKKRKEIIKYYQLATSACCGDVVRNECRDHFSIIIPVLKILWGHSSTNQHGSASSPLNGGSLFCFCIYIYIYYFLTFTYVQCLPFTGSAFFLFLVYI